MDKISILLPTRKRFESFKVSIDSLFNNCNNTENFEVLVAIDLDDDEIDKIKEYSSNKDNIKLFYYERQFYRGLHNYYNDLSLKSEGSSLFLWNDDAIMKSQNWDLEIINKHKDFCVLSPKVDTMEQYWSTQGVLFPIIPKKWIDITGKWSHVPSCDSWTDVISKRLGILVNVDTIVISHNRYDITGENHDSTYIEGRSDINNHEYFSLFNVGFSDIMEEHYQKILNYLNNNQK
jgi:hypothetical protein